MNDKELLDVLKTESILAEVRAVGAKEAYQQEAMRQARKALFAKDIYPGDKVVVRFTNGDFVYVFRRIEWSYGKHEPWIWGSRVLKSGKLSKLGGLYGIEVCGISALPHVRKKT